MKLRTAALLIMCIPGLASCDQTSKPVEKEPFAEQIYHIDSQADFDKYTNYEFPPASKVLFAADAEFEGQFILRGSGTAESPNLLCAYDRGTGEVLREWTDRKPVINGSGNVQSSLLLENGSFWEINNIELTNTNGSNGNQGDILGICVIAEDVGLVQDLSIRNCYVHDVNGKVGGKQTGGIHVYVRGKKVKTKFHRLLIENNHISHVGGVGIANQSSWGNIQSESYHPWTYMAIRGNLVEYTGRNGIIVRYSRDPLVEYNVLAYNSLFDTGHSVFNFNTIGCIVQYNEAYGNTSDNPDDIDHGGFDADWNSRGTIIQYNYSHDNNWFCGIMRRKVNTDITIRYNISQNELLGAYIYGFPGDKGLKDVKVYNNTHFFGRGKGSKVFVSAGKVRIPTETAFRNNIFYFEDQADWGFDPDQTCILENNLFYNVAPKGSNYVTSDPLFVSPGTGGTRIDMKDPDRLSGYRLRDGSPARGAAKLIEDNGGQDFGGNPLPPDKINIGAW